jgi:high-affinity iron transporter
MKRPLDLIRAAALRAAGAVVFTLSVAFALTPSAHAAEVSPRSVVHLLDYIASDYAGAVADGRVVSAEEYGEMKEFSAEALRSAMELPELTADPRIGTQLRELVQLVDRRASVADVAREAGAIKAAIIARTHLAIAPTTWPDLAQGQALYKTACAVCHGPTGHGDGRVAATLKPTPANFYDESRMKTLAPFHAFNTIRLGVPGTSMPAFSSLRDDETWALAFYVISLRHGSAPSADPSPVALEVAASESDEHIAGRLAGDDAQRKKALAAVRLFSGTGGVHDTLETAESLLSEAETAYRAGRYSDARRSALTAYLEGIEPVEARLRALSPATVVELERRMAAVRTAIEQRQPATMVARAVEEAKTTVRTSRERLRAPRSSPWFVFSMAGAIVLREAFEAVLIIVAMLSVLRAVGAKRAARWVHAGWIAAIVVGAFAWVVSDSLVRGSGVNRELLEAVTSLLAVVVLLYMGFWLHRRTEIARWKAFIEQQVTSTLSSGKLVGLAVISFFAVFREALETVLFLVALSLDAEGGQRFIAAGVITSLVCTLLMAWALVRFSARLPLRTMFAVTASLMMALSVVLAGKALHAFQEIGTASVTALPFDFRVDLLGIYPTVETIVAQAAVALFSIILWFRAQPRTSSK